MGLEPKLRMRISELRFCVNINLLSISWFLTKKYVCFFCCFFYRFLYKRIRSASNVNGKLRKLSILMDKKKRRKKKMLSRAMAAKLTFQICVLT